MNGLLRQIGEQHVISFFLVLARVGPLFVVAPLFSSKMIPLRARGVAAVALAVGLSPIALKDGKLPTDALSLAGLVGKEALVGFAFAFAISVLFAAVSVAGSFLDTLIGFSYGGLVDPVNGNQSSVLSQLYTLVGVMVFLAIGGDTWMIQGLGKTYDLVGLTDLPSIGTMVGGAQHTFATIFVSAVEIAAPVLIALIITDAGFGVVSRVMPQLNVFAVGFPAKILVGFLIVAASLPFVAGWIGNQLQQSVMQALQTLRVA
ncbi:MAG: flagellar biosynthesis protein FliR [Thermoleophilaceae bacterium]|nr:flagellar biosynthesis protein FliR [Thermoleophilaceae bacterium]